MEQEEVLRRQAWKVLFVKKFGIKKATTAAATTTIAKTTSTATTI